MKVKDGIIGLVVGDALGVPFEFQSRESLLLSPATDMVGYGTYNMPTGTFSDDSSMALATMASIVNNNGEIDYRDIMEEFVQWWQHQKYTQYDNTFDIGITTASALRNFTLGMDPLESGLSGERDNGNGSLMRILPLAFLGDIDVETIENVSALTHGHERSKMACVFYIELAKSILNENKSIREHVQIASDKVMDYYGDSPELGHYKRIFDGTIFDDGLESISSKGYVVSTLEAVIYVLGNSDSYKEAMLKSVNLGNDTDTVAAIAGGIAGLYYGYDNIPNEWVEQIKDVEKVIDLCEKLETIIN